MKILFHLIFEVTLTVVTDVITTLKLNSGKKDLIMRKHMSMLTGYDYQTSWTELLQN